MATITIDTLGPLSPPEEACIRDVLSDYELASKNDSRHLPPRMYRPTGEVDQLQPLAYLVIGFLGTSALVVLHAFLKKVGSELGDRFIGKYMRKVPDGDGPEPLFRVAAYYESEDGRRIIIPIPVTKFELNDETLVALDKILTDASTMHGSYILHEEDGSLKVEWMNANFLGVTLWRDEPNKYPSDPEDF
jgi:hypothetical protein